MHSERILACFTDIIAAINLIQRWIADLDAERTVKAIALSNAGQLMYKEPIREALS